MSKYLVCCDLDDTLLTTKKTIKRKSRKLIKKFVDNGNYFCICTGRPYSGAIMYYKRLGLSMPLICDNGASIYLPKRGEFIRKSFAIDREYFLKFYNEAKEYTTGVFSQMEKSMISDNPDIFPRWIIHDEIGYPLIVGDLNEVVTEDLPLPNFKVKHDKKQEFEELLNKYPEIGYRYWGEYDNLHSYELYSINASKGKALLYCADLLGVDHKNTLAFGDQMNDISMLEMAGCGVCMINGSATVREKIDEVTEYDCNHNGVAMYLKKKLKNGR